MAKMRKKKRRGAPGPAPRRGVLTGMRSGYKKVARGVAGGPTTRSWDWLGWLALAAVIAWLWLRR